MKIHAVKPLMAAALGIAAASSCVSVAREGEQKLEPNMEIVYKAKEYPVDIFNKIVTDMGLQFGENEGIQNVPAISFNDKDGRNYYLFYDASLNRPECDKYNRKKHGNDTLYLTNLVINDGNGYCDTLKFYDREGSLFVESSNKKYDGVSIFSGADAKFDEARGDKVVAQWYPLSIAGDFARESENGIEKFNGLTKVDKVPQRVYFAPYVNTWNSDNNQKNL